MQEQAGAGLCHSRRRVLHRLFVTGLPQPVGDCVAILLMPAECVCMHVMLCLLR